MVLHPPVELAVLTGAVGKSLRSFQGLEASKAKCVSGVYGAGDGNRTNPNEPNKGVTTRSAVQLESNGVKLNHIV